MHTHAADPSTNASQYMHWEAHAFGDGPLQFVLMHVTADPCGFMSGAHDYRVLASARLVLADGIVYGLGIAAPSGALLDVCRTVAEVLHGQAYDEASFDRRDRELAAALCAAGHQGVRATLERAATTHPRPAIAASRLDRLLPALKDRRRTSAEATPTSSPPGAQAAFPQSRRRPGYCAIAGYRAVLDAHALAYQESGISVCGIAADRLSVYNLIAGTAGAGRYRAQALQALPWLLPVLAAPGQQGRGEVMRILDAIDGASSLHAAVAASFDVPREVVRWLGRRVLPDSWQLDVPRLRRLLAALSWLPPERRPRNPSEFAALMDTCNALAALLRFDPDRSERGLVARLDRYGPCMRRWMDDLSRPGRTLAPMAGDRRQLALELSEAGDFLQALAESTQDKRRIGWESATADVLRWCAATGLGRLIELSREWHAFAATAATQVGDDAAVLRWPPILPQEWQYGRLKVVELVSSTQLLVEGQRMRHCVASLDRACCRGRSAVMSLCDESGRVASTAELRFCDEPGLQVAIEQHKSVHNGPPDSLCEEALAALVRHLNHPDVAPLLRVRRDFQRRQHALAYAHAAEARQQHELHAGQTRECAWRLANLAPKESAQAGAVTLPCPIPQPHSRRT